MKPPKLSWSAFLRKQWALVPVIILMGWGITETTLFGLYSLYEKDILILKGKASWDKLDLLRNPRHRKLLRYNEDFDAMPEMQCLYNDMDRIERERARRRRRERETAAARDECE